jgi:hypothetical protein
MTFDASSFSGSESARRKTYAMVAAGFCILLFVMVYAFSGAKTAPKKVAEPDQQLASIDDQPAANLDQMGGNPNWYDNVPAGMTTAQTPQSGPNVKDSPTTPLSPVVTGDNPSAEPLADSELKPGHTPEAPMLAQTRARGDAVPTSSASGAEPVSYNKASAASQSQNSNPPTPPALPNSTVATVPPANAAKAPVPAPVATIPPVSAPAGKSTPGNASVATSGQANTPVAAVPPVLAPEAKIGAPAASPAPPLSEKKEKGTASTQRPKFVRPAQKQPGIIARTRELITELEFDQSPKPVTAQTKAGQTSAKPAAAEPTAPTSVRGQLIPSPSTSEIAAEPAAPTSVRRQLIPSSSTSGIAAESAPPARVRQQEARSFAAQMTEQMRKQRLIKPDERIRLPRSIETPNPTIWREDDTPATAEERRPFGLVLAEENPAFTPEGIPLRTDIPAGSSPLEKTGPDKPLWKRPE